MGYPLVYVFSDDVVLFGESRAGVNRKLELCLKTLESKGYSVERKHNIWDVILALHMRKDMLVWKVK
jgi:hypothetical protein